MIKPSKADLILANVLHPIAGIVTAPIIAFDYGASH